MYVYQRLHCWRRAHALAVGAFSERLLDQSTGGRIVGGQLRRSLLSIVANLAEGAASGSRPMAARYFRIAMASAHESEAVLLVARDSGVVPTDVAEAWLRELSGIKRMLSALVRAVQLPKHSPSTERTSPNR